MRKIGGLLSAAAIACLLVAAAATSSDAAVRKHAKAHSGSYDGLWSVSILTQYGPCDRSYRYPARIVGGRVQQADNDFSYQLYGAVSKSGAISVTVSKSGQSATGYGRLHGASGGGRWSAAGGQCSGTWTTSRRR
jgi:hypothetical protein